MIAAQGLGIDGLGLRVRDWRVEVSDSRLVAEP